MELNISESRREQFSGYTPRESEAVLAIAGSLLTVAGAVEAAGSLLDDLGEDGGVIPSASSKPARSFASDKDLPNPGGRYGLAKVPFAKVDACRALMCAVLRQHTVCLSRTV